MGLVAHTWFQVRVFRIHLDSVEEALHRKGSARAPSVSKLCQQTIYTLLMTPCKGRLGSNDADPECARMNCGPSGGDLTVGRGRGRT